MSDPRRLVDQPDDDLGRLLSAGRSEGPDEAQMLALAAKLGALGALGAIGASAAGAGAAGAGAAGASGAGAGAGASGAVGAGAAGASGAAGAGAVGAGNVAVAVTAAKVGLAAKIGGAVAIASIVGTTAVVATRTQEAPVEPVGLVATSAPSGAASTRAGANGSSAGTAASLTLPATEALDAPSSDTSAAPASSVTAVPSAAHKTKPAAPPSAEGPEAEVRLLERAQDALRARPAEALAIADDHARRFPQGMLAQEREVIAIEALVKTGRAPEARARAARFTSRFPGSSHTRRIQTLVAE